MGERFTRDTVEQQYLNAHMPCYATGSGTRNNFLKGEFQTKKLRIALNCYKKGTRWVELREPEPTKC